MADQTNLARLPPPTSAPETTAGSSKGSSVAVSAGAPSATATQTISGLQTALGNASVQQIVKAPTTATQIQSAARATPLSANLSPEDRRIVLFNRAITAEEAAVFIWGNAVNAGLLVPGRSERSGKAKQTHFRLNLTDVGQIVSMRHGLAQRYIQMSIIRSVGKIPPLEEQMPKWLPNNVRTILLKQYHSGGLPRGAQIFPAPEPWGSIVAWHGPDEFGQESIQFYQEYPSDLNWYLNFTDGSRSQARLLHKVYTQFNRDMRYFIAQGRSPFSARDEIRRINEEVFKLVVMGAFSVLASGVGISAINNQMRQTLLAAERTGLRTIASAEEHGAIEAEVEQKAASATKRAWKPVPTKGTAGSRRTSVAADVERRTSAAESLPAYQQRIRDQLAEEHPDLHPNVAAEASKGGARALGASGGAAQGGGADVVLLNGGGREVSVHRGGFTGPLIGGHLQTEALQRNTTEIYLQINTPGATQSDLIKMIPQIRSSYPELKDVFVRIFGSDGKTWWSGFFRGPL